MKEIYRKEKGVSPVIATILMVAITVVLAATVYIMVSNMGSVNTNHLAGSLILHDENKEKGYYNYTLSISINSIAPENAVITVNGQKLNYSQANPGNNEWSFIDLNGDGQLSNGDIIVIHTSAQSGSIIALSVSGYAGNIQTTIP